MRAGVLYILSVVYVPSSQDTAAHSFNPQLKYYHCQSKSLPRNPMRQRTLNGPRDPSWTALSRASIVARDSLKILSHPPHFSLHPPMNIPPLLPPRRSTAPKWLVCAAALFLAAATSRAGVVTWTGNGGDGNWS